MKKIGMIIMMGLLVMSCKKDEVIVLNQERGSSECKGTIIIDRVKDVDCSVQWIIWSDIDDVKTTLYCNEYDKLYTVSNYNLVCDNPSTVYWIKRKYEWSRSGGRYINDTMTYKMADGKTLTFSNR